MSIFGFSAAKRESHERAKHQVEDDAERDVMKEQIDSTRAQLEYIRQEARFFTRAQIRSHEERRHGTPRRTY